MGEMSYVSSFGDGYRGRNVVEEEDASHFAELLSQTANNSDSVGVHSRVERLTKKGHRDLSHRVVFSFIKGFKRVGGGVCVDSVHYTRLFNGEVAGGVEKYMEDYLRGIGEDVLEFDPELDVRFDAGVLRVSRRTH